MTVVRARPRRPWRAVVRSNRDAALLVIGAVTLGLSAIPVDQYRISTAETDVFRVINDHTVLPFTVVWVIMQLGNFIAVPVAALVAALLRRFRLALAILAGGLATYYLAKLVKSLVVRGRPSSLLHDVVIRGAAALGRGYVSGHAAVVTLLTTLAWAYLPTRWRWVPVALAVFVCLARMYVGAHLPLDVIGGAALGLAVGGACRLVFGRPAS